MVKVKKGSLLDGVTGKFGEDLIFRKSNGQTIASNVSSKKVKATEKRLNQRAKFKVISPLAKEAIADPVKRARYEAAREPGQSAYNVAFSEIYDEYFPGEKPADKIKNKRKKKFPGKTLDGKGIKDIILLIDTDTGTLLQTEVTVPDQHVLDWILAAAKMKTSEPVSNILVRIRYI